METLAFAVTTTPQDPVPQDDDVVAGPWGALIFVVLIGATVFLLFNFTKQLRKAQAAKDAGVFGDPPAEAADETDETDEPDDSDDARDAAEEAAHTEES
ncbi:hypothetical protein [Nocardioides sp.]|uniref:hypothetical protein n=1 Tax=Nocardioides sp. TaxID=35761 RepID=UPI0035293FBB